MKDPKAPSTSARPDPAKGGKTPDLSGHTVTAQRVDRASRLRSKIQASIDSADAEKRRNNFLRRIDLARNGVRSYQLHRIGEAARSFHMYIRVLEDWKGVPEGGLNPGVFDMKKDLSELLLISGVYWDLVKLYDRVESKTKQKEFLHFLEKFLLFSRGMPYQALSAETMRRYISHNRTKHRSEFKNAYRILSGSSCFVATALLDVCDEDTLPLLRAFRDERLVRSAPGRWFIDWYYRHGPRLAAVTERLPEPVRAALGRLLDGVARLV